MGKKKTKYKPPGYKNPTPSDIKHVQLFRGFLRHPAYVRLSPSAKVLYQELRLQERGDYGDVILTYAQAKEYTSLSDRTISRAYKELEDAGFIELKKQGGITGGGKNPSVYKFSIEYINKERELEQARKSTAD